MKKLIAAILLGALTLSLTSCGSTDSASTAAPAASTAAPATTAAAGESKTVAVPGLNPVEAVFLPGTSSSTGAYATIRLSADVKMDDESAWLGLCPAGNDYITEEEADEVDVIWFNADAPYEGYPYYVFACDFSTVEDGTYALVVATSDDAAVGYIVIQLEMTKSGETLHFDYTNAQLKERPAK